MSDILLKSIHFPQLDARYIVGDDTLSEEGAAADAKETGDALALKADKTDTYTKEQVDDMVGDAKTELEEAIDDLEENKLAIDGYSELATVGNAEQLVATQHITDTEPYNFRKTGGPNDVGDRVYDTLVGGSVVWNQLVDSGATEVTVPNGHKYYANINGTKSIGASTGTAISINDSTKDNVIDLTAALGSTIADYVYSLETANAGDGVAWFKKYFPGIYYGYCEPHFEHVQTSQKTTVGFNQWDEEWESGYINANGSMATGTTSIRSKNFCECLPNTAYCFTKPSTYTQTPNICWYDGSKAFISRSTTTPFPVMTSPENARYFKISCYNYGSTYNHDICINLHGDRDGEYEPYRKRTYPIEPKVLRGVPKLDSANRLYFDGDVMRHDGSGEERYGIVNSADCVIGAYDANTGRWSLVMPSSAPLHKRVPVADILTMFPSNGFKVTSKNGVTQANYSISASDPSNSSSYIFTLDSTQVTTVTQAIEWVQAHPFDLVYELDEPEPFTAEPYQSPMVVDPLGTEEFVDYAVEQGERDVKIPVGHSSSYPADLRGKLQRLPSPIGTNGDYIVTEIDGKLYLKPYVPAVGLTMTAPTNEGEGE